MDPLSIVYTSFNAKGKKSVASKTKTKVGLVNSIKYKKKKEKEERERSIWTHTANKFILSKLL